MGIKFKRLYQARLAYRRSDNLGDFALLKADAWGAKVNPAIAKKMEQIRGYSSTINLFSLTANMTIAESHFLKVIK